MYYEVYVISGTESRGLTNKPGMYLRINLIRNRPLNLPVNEIRRSKLAPQKSRKPNWYEWSRPAHLLIKRFIHSKTGRDGAS